MNKLKKPKRGYEKKLTGRLTIPTSQDFLLARLEKEWEDIERTAKKEQLVRRAKEGGKAAGKLILSLLAIGGVLSVAMVAPNILCAYGQFAKHRGYFQQDKFNQGKRYLQKKGYFSTVSSGKNGLKIRITKLGLTHALNNTFSNLAIEKPKIWDGLWRMVIFDIPDKHKWARDSFRWKLKILGFYQVQESVFVSPYPCDQEIMYLASVFNISSYVRFIQAGRMNQDRDAREYFDLH
ncbi:MAG: hypothetical protein HY978_01540 [Candidatus Liptonbacteria bacterium]|nr:hypothetical protein [Candidatus Liptonbacteria bacterium]